MISRMEQIIEEIEEFIDHCKYQMLSNTKIVVNRDELEELLAELKQKTPEEIKKYQKIISNKEAILADAHAKSESILAEAQIHTNELVSEHQIMQQAYAQANQVVLIATNQAQEILDSATNDANNIRTSAIVYTDDMLANLENLIGSNMETSKIKFENYYNNLLNCYEIVNGNRRELSPKEEEPEMMQQMEEQENTIVNLDIE